MYKMRKSFLGSVALALVCIGLSNCSTDDGGSDIPENPSSGSTGSVGQIPENTDSGKNNNSDPDNIGHGTNEGSAGESSGWQLVFDDDFVGEDSIPNTDYWSLAPKGDKTWNRHMSESYGQAYQKDGYLYLFGMQSDGEYLTGGIESREKFDFTYGQVKCRARFLRHPQGNHTGIWMMPEPPAQEWPKSGEIDIMEHLDNDDVVYETVHYWNPDSEEDDKSYSTAKVDVDEFNVYGIIWDNDSITFTVNGKESFTYKNNGKDVNDFNYFYPFTSSFYLILSQSLGGPGTWAGEIDDDGLPSIFQIDWIKVWQKSE